MKRTLGVIDTWISPTPNFANKSHTDFLITHLKRLLSGRALLSSSARLVFLATFILVSKILFPIACILKRIGYRFVDIDLSQIGSILFLDFLLREDALEKNTPRAKLLVAASNYHDSNRYILDLYRHRVRFVRGILPKLVLAPFFVSKVFAEDTSHSYEQVHGTRPNIMGVWQRYINDKGSPIVSMPVSDIKKAKGLLRPFMNNSKPFVSLHVRDSGFYGLKTQNQRNADIFTYEKAIGLLISKGYVVVRLGDANMCSAEKLSQKYGSDFFDYPHSKIKSEFMDCYLLSECAFMIGCASGPSNIPPIFNKNCVLVNYFNVVNCAYFMEGDLAAFKKFVNVKTGKLIPFEEIIRPPFNLNPSPRELEDHGADVIDNTDDEIHDTVLEYLEQLPLTNAQKKAKALLNPRCYSYGAAGNYAHTIVKQYF